MNKVNVKIPAYIYKAMSKYNTNKQEFKTTDEYIAFVLRQIIDVFHRQNQERELKKGDEKKAKKALKTLGYIE